MALYVHAQDLYRSTLIGETFREALEEFLDEEIPSRKEEKEAEEVAEKEGADGHPDSAVESSALSNHNNDDSSQQQQGAIAEDGRGEGVVGEAAAGPDVDGIQTLCLFELEKATCRAFSQLVGQDSGEYV